MEKVKVGIIGCGRIAQHHLKTLKAFDDVEIVAACNRSYDKLMKTARDFQIKDTYNDYKKMLESHKLDAIFNLVNVLYVKDVTLDCLDYGVPLLVEKPVGICLEDTKEVMDKANEKNVEVMVGVNRRFISTVMDIIRIAEEDGGIKGILMNAPENINFTKSLNIHPKEVIDKWIYANGVHCIDLISYFGRRILEVHSYSDAAKNNFSAHIKTSNGPVHYVSFWTRLGDWEVTFFSEHKRIALSPLEKGIVEELGKEQIALSMEKIDYEFKPGFYRQNRYFIDAVKNKSEISYPACNISEAYDVMKLVERIENKLL